MGSCLLLAQQGGDFCNRLHPEAYAAGEAAKVERRQEKRSEAAGSGVVGYVSSPLFLRAC